MADFAKLYNTSRKISGRSNSVPLEWYKSTNKPGKSEMLLRANSDDKNSTLTKIKICCLVGSFILIALQTIFSSYIVIGSGDMVLACLLMTSMLLGFIYFILIQNKSTEIAAFFNRLLQFDRKYGKAAKPLRMRASREMLRICFSYFIAKTADVVAIGFSFGLHWQNPKKPTLAGYWLIWETLDGVYPVIGRVTNVASTIGVCYFNYWIWCVALEPAHFVVGAFVNLCIIILEDNLKLFEKFCDQGEFSCYKLGEIFRHNQLLVAMYNEVQSGLPMLSIITAAISILAFAVSDLVKLTSYDAMMVALPLYFSCAAVVGITFLIGGMSLVYERSKILLKRKMYNVGGNLSRMERKWENRFYKSCSPWKVMISSGNFVDQLTPLNMLSYAMNLTVNIILVQ